MLSLTIKKKLRMFENRTLRKISGSKMAEVIGDCIVRRSFMFGTLPHILRG
jgi:hypothetical protein